MRCQDFIAVFKICNTRIIMDTLNCRKEYVKAAVFFYLQFFSYVYLIAATIGMKVWLKVVNARHIEKEEKLYSLFSLMLKNIPKYYTLDQLRKEVTEMMPEAEICELFFVHETA